MTNRDTHCSSTSVRERESDAEGYAKPQKSVCQHEFVDIKELTEFLPSADVGSMTFCCVLVCVCSSLSLSLSVYLFLCLCVRVIKMLSQCVEI